MSDDVRHLVRAIWLEIEDHDEKPQFQAWCESPELDDHGALLAYPVELATEPLFATCAACLEERARAAQKLNSGATS